ncbi:hypothetical protein LCGC14_1646450 [marine sediment metagenome]|uniref:Uncharacterized protein n=1 Tax=marine sediment metagenome TaxID=412755 RepID=A0A0F9KY20_9ZZZZ
MIVEDKEELDKGNSILYTHINNDIFRVVIQNE